MVIARTRSTVSRRVALSGLGAGGLGLALATGARGVSAQDASGEMASHPVVGLWQDSAAGPDAEMMAFLFSIYHADGTYQSWNGLDSGAALGIWRPTGDRTADLLFIYQDIDPTITAEVPGTATFRISLEVDETGNTLTGSGSLDVRDPVGTLLLEIPDFPFAATRVTFDHNPATGSTVSATASPEAATPAT